MKTNIFVESPIVRKALTKTLNGYRGALQRLRRNYPHNNLDYSGEKEGARNLAWHVDFALRNLKCQETKSLHDMTMRCSLPLGHSDTHRFDKVAPVTIEYDSDEMDNAADEMTGYTNNQLVSRDDRYEYSTKQIRKAIWQTLNDYFETLDIAALMREKWTHFQLNLSDPEVDRAEEARLDAADRAYDEHVDRMMEKEAK